MTNFIEIEKGWITGNVGSVVEFSPATREARVRFPDVAMRLIQFVVDSSVVNPSSFLDTFLKPSEIVYFKIA